MGFLRVTDKLSEAAGRLLESNGCSSGCHRSANQGEGIEHPGEEELASIADREIDENERHGCVMKKRGVAARRNASTSM